MNIASIAAWQIFAVATHAGQLKVGSFSRSELMVKWNEVIRIARELGPGARFTGWPPRRP